MFILPRPKTCKAENILDYSIGLGWAKLRCKCGSSIFTYSGIIIGKLGSFTEAKCVECGERN
jgi:hypothetical protein